MSLSPEKLKLLKKQSHSLNPVVLLGAKGLTEAVQQEINVALGVHELIKIRVNALDRAERTEIITQICTAQQAELVQQIGHLAVIYRKRPDKDKAK